MKSTEANGTCRAGAQLARAWFVINPRRARRRAASSLLLHETKFRRIRGYKQMHLLVTALENVDTKQAVA